MRLLTFLAAGNQQRVGILDKERQTVIDVEKALEWLHEPSSSPLDMLTVIRDSSRYLPLFEKILVANREQKLPASALKSEKDLQIVSPVPRPVSMRDGYAFRQHVEAARRNRGVPMIPEFD